MSNVYIYDFVFIILYLVLREWALRFRICKPDWFDEFRDYFHFVEFIVLLMYLYVRPAHNDSERAVSLGAMAFTGLCWYVLITKKRLK